MSGATGGDRLGGGYDPVAVAGAASAVTIDFDALPAGTLVTTRISGVAFTLANGSAPAVLSPAFEQSPGTTSSPPNALLNASAFASSVSASDLTISFAAPVDDLSFTPVPEPGTASLLSLALLGLCVLTGQADFRS